MQNETISREYTDYMQTKSVKNSFRSLRALETWSSKSLTLQAQSVDVFTYGENPAKRQWVPRRMLKKIIPQILLNSHNYLYEI